MKPSIVIANKFPRLKRSLWKRWYEFLAFRYLRQDWTFMNYGYASLDRQAKRLELEDTDEPDRYCIQLYYHVASRVSVEGLDVLEVGSGRGGGASFVRRYLKPKTMVGVDFSEKAIAFCKQRYDHDGLSFEVGDAESLPMKDGRFDVVVNVESSHCYGSMVNFLQQVKRVLRDGGFFLFADLREKSMVDLLSKQIRGSGFSIVEETDITANVVKALELDSERKIALIDDSIGNWLRKLFYHFAAVKGSKTYKDFRSGKITYVCYVLQKQ